MSLTRDELIKTACWSCWWREGGRCYNEELWPVTTDSKGFRVGFEINQPVDLCTGYKSKRSVLEPYFGDKWVILFLSEHTTD